MKINLRVFCSLKLSIFILLSFLLTWGTPLVSQERFRRSPPYPEPLPELNLPDIESTTLSNGLFLSVVRRENLPAISL
ncbi:MAG: peptidase M16, partial [Candidatus Aminicenantes bacterium]|nr:peptidase M16 [Candidatus Aminicenantes bacterium]